MSNEWKTLFNAINTLFIEIILKILGHEFGKLYAKNIGGIQKKVGNLIFQEFPKNFVNVWDFLIKFHFYFHDMLVNLKIEFHLIF